MTEHEITERVRRLMDLLVTQTVDIERREAARLETMGELRAYRVPFREIGEAAHLNHQTIANRLAARALTAASKPDPKEQS